MLTVVSPATWKMVIDLSGTVSKAPNSDLLGGIASSGFALSGHNHDSAYAAIGHNHNSAYLGITAKAADADKLDGFDSTAFVRSVNGVGPDGNGNSSIPIDLSSRVAKTGDTMSGTLTVPRLQIASTANYIDMVDQDWGTRYLHHNGGLMGFLRSDGSWDMYMNNSGSLWTCNYGWLQDYFFNVVSNCVRVNNNPSSGWQGAPNCQITDNCYNCGDQAPYAYYNLVTLFDQGGTLRLGAYGTRYNCNCDCNCC